MRTVTLFVLQVGQGSATEIDSASGIDKMALHLGNPVHPNVLEEWKVDPGTC
jgi:hypothetical protein